MVSCRSGVITGGGGSGEGEREGERTWRTGEFEPAVSDKGDGCRGCGTASGGGEITSEEDPDRRDNGYHVIGEPSLDDDKVGTKVSGEDGPVSDNKKLKGWRGSVYDKPLSSMSIGDFQTDLIEPITYT